MPDCFALGFAYAQMIYENAEPEYSTCLRCGEIIPDKDIDSGASKDGLCADCLTLLIGCIE